MRGDFRELLHPRDRHGRFLLKGGGAAVLRDRTGKVRHLPVPHLDPAKAKHAAARALGVAPLPSQLIPVAPADPGRPVPPPPDPALAPGRIARLRDSLDAFRKAAAENGVSPALGARAYLAIANMELWFRKQADYFNPVGQDAEVTYYNWGYVWESLASVVKVVRHATPVAAEAVMRLLSAAREAPTPDELRLVEAWLAEQRALEDGRLDLAEAARAEVDRLAAT